MNLELLQETMKNHHKTFPDARPLLVMPAATRAGLFELYKTPPPELLMPLSLTQVIAQLAGVPIVLDNGCEVAWRLIDGRTGDVLVSDAS